MDERPEWPEGSERLAYAGLSVQVDEAVHVATLRYFAPGGAVAQALRELTGAALPDVLQAVAAAEGEVILAWRSPTETLCLTGSAMRLSQLGARLAHAADGCMVDLTGALKVVRVRGARSAELLCRLGGTAAVPQPGEARRGRLADVPVLTLSLRAGETLLVLDRACLPHVFAWIRETLLDFAAA
jgi:sarcosine oxidase gamma subunit